jgi:hypothetical protein
LVKNRKIENIPFTTSHFEMSSKIAPFEVRKIENIPFPTW